MGCGTANCIWCGHINMFNWTALIDRIDPQLDLCSTMTLPIKIQDSFIYIALFLTHKVLWMHCTSSRGYQHAIIKDYNHRSHWKAMANRCIFSSALKFSSLSIVQSLLFNSEFQYFGPAMLIALSTNVFLWVKGTTNSLSSGSWVLPFCTLAWKRSFMYCGASPYWALWTNNRTL